MTKETSGKSTGTQKERSSSSYSSKDSPGSAYKRFESIEDPSAPLVGGYDGNPILKKLAKNREEREEGTQVNSDTKETPEKSTRTPSEKEEYVARKRAERQDAKKSEETPASRSSSTYSSKGNPGSAYKRFESIEDPSAPLVGGYDGNPILKKLAKNREEREKKETPISGFEEAKSTTPPNSTPGGTRGRDGGRTGR